MSSPFAARAEDKGSAADLNYSRHRPHLLAAPLDLFHGRTLTA
jgi:hypothetical protein